MKNSDDKTGKEDNSSLVMSDRPATRSDDFVAHSSSDSSDGSQSVTLGDNDKSGTEGSSNGNGVFASPPIDVPYVIPKTEKVPEVPITVDSPVTDSSMPETNSRKDVSVELDSVSSDIKTDDKSTDKSNTLQEAESRTSDAVLQGNDKKPQQHDTDVTYAPQLKQSHGVDFVTIVSHQLRTPLTGIKWYVDLLLSGQAGKIGPRQRDYLLDIHQANERMIRLVDNLLIIEQLESEKLSLIARTAYLPELISGITSEYDEYVKVHGISLVSQCPNIQRTKVKIDPIYIRLALKNVIDNALRYTPEGGTVSIECSYVSPETDPEIKQPMAQIVISDTGIGIPPEDRAEVFKKFYRSQVSMKMQTEGTGLGLFITKVIIEKSGGRIWFKSRDEDPLSGQKTGTDFFIQLPVVS